MEEALAHYQRALPYFIRSQPLAALRLAEMEWIPSTHAIDTTVTSAEERSTEKLWSSLNLSTVDLLCLYGIGNRSFYSKIFSWLKEDSKRHVRILEDDPQVLLGLLHTDIGYQLVSHPQVGLHFLEGGESQRLLLTQFVWDFLRSNWRFAAAKTDLDAKKLERMHQLHEELEIIRTQVKQLADEFFTYGISYFENFYANLPLLPTSGSADRLFGRFRGIPIFVCGSGPSLETEIEHLKPLLNRGLLVAAGSAVPVLLSHGIVPHFGVAIDPTISQAERLEKQKDLEIPYFYRPRLHPRALRAIRGPRLYVSGAGAYEAPLYLEHLLKLPTAQVDEGHNVLQFALSIAKALQGKPSPKAPLVLLGADGAYKEGHEYSIGIPDSTRPQINDANTLALKADREGNLLVTRKQWIAERAWITQFAQENGDWLVINASEGLPISGVNHLTLTEVAKRYCKRTYDLSAKVLAELQRTQCPAKAASKIAKLLKTWQKSLDRVASAIELTEQHVKENHWHDVAYASSLWQEESAYQAILAPFEKMYVRIQHVDEVQSEKLEERERLIAQQKLFQERLHFLKKGCAVHQKLLQSACSDLHL